MIKRGLSMLLATIMLMAAIPAVSAAAGKAREEHLIIKTGNELYPEYDVTRAEAYGWVHVDLEEPLDVSLSGVNWSLQTLNGEIIDQDTFADKIVILVFYKAVLGEESCARSARMITGLAESTWVDRDDVQIIAVDANDSDADMVAAYKAEHAPDCDNIVFAVNGNSTLWKFVRLQDSGLDSIGYTYCAIIQDNMLRYGLNMVDNATACKFRIIRLLGEEEFISQGSAVDGKLDGVYWQLDPIGILTISGSGDLPSFEFGSNVKQPPWSQYNDEVLCVIIESGVTGIGSTSLRSFEYLDSVIIENGLTKLDSNAVFYCQRLTTVTLPGSLSSIGYHAFQQCDRLSDIYYGGSKAQLEKIAMDNSWLANKVVHYNSYVPGFCFADVPADAWYAGAVSWATKNEITAGVGDDRFAPDRNCDRAQIVTFLWRSNGAPEPKSSANPFTDVSASDYYYKAVLWAVENDIVSGIDATHFSPNAPCTRAQVVTLQYRAAGKPIVAEENSFTDVPPDVWYTDAVRWAVHNNITQGYGDGKFSPDENCTRAQVVTLFYRNMAQ